VGVRAAALLNAQEVRKELCSNYLRCDEHPALEPEQVCRILWLEVRKSRQKFFCRVTCERLSDADMEES